MEFNHKYTSNWYKDHSVYLNFDLTKENIKHQEGCGRWGGNYICDGLCIYVCVRAIQMKARRTGLTEKDFLDPSRIYGSHQ